MFAAINLTADVGGGGIVGSGTGGSGIYSFPSGGGTVSVAPVAAVAAGPAGVTLGPGGANESGIFWDKQHQPVSDIYYLGDKPYSEPGAFSDQLFTGANTTQPNWKPILLLAAALLLAKNL